MFNEVLFGFTFIRTGQPLLNRNWVQIIVVSANYLLKLFSCAVVFMLICYGKMKLVERGRMGENIFWKQFKTAFDVVYHMCLNRADGNMLRSPFVSSKLRVFGVLGIAFLVFHRFFFNISCLSKVCFGVCMPTFTFMLLKTTVSKYNLTYVF